MCFLRPIGYGTVRVPALRRLQAADIAPDNAPFTCAWRRQ